MCLWGWYIVPLGVATISLVHAVGIGCVATLLRYNGRPREYSDDERLERIAESFIVIGIVLLTGWITKFWMPQ